jgi:hypothetical protein
VVGRACRVGMACAGRGRGAPARPAQGRARPGQAACSPQLRRGRSPAGRPWPAVARRARVAELREAPRPGCAPSFASPAAGLAGPPAAGAPDAWGGAGRAGRTATSLSPQAALAHQRRRGAGLGGSHRRHRGERGPAAAAVPGPVPAELGQPPRPSGGLAAEPGPATPRRKPGSRGRRDPGPARRARPPVVGHRQPAPWLVARLRGRGGAGGVVRGEGGRPGRPPGRRAPNRRRRDGGR